MAVEWRVHPARERRAATLALLAVLAAILAAVWVAFSDPLLLLLSVAILGSALGSWFLPTTYRLDDEGASERRTGWRRARRWSEVRSAYADRRGVTLSPFAKPSWLEPYRGIRLLFAGNRDEVLSAIEERAPGACRRTSAKRAEPAEPASGGARRATPN